MFEELRAAFEHRQDKSRVNEENGKILDILRQITYFRQLNQRYGTEYLDLYLPLLSTFIHRQGLLLIDENDLYVLLEGTLVEQGLCFYHPIEIGKPIQIDYKKRVIAETDCKMIRMRRGDKVRTYIEKKIRLGQRQRRKKLKEFDRLIQSSVGSRDTLEAVSGISYFSSLGQYDRKELSLKSQLKEYNQGHQTHEKGKEVHRIGFIVDGRVKMIFSEGNEDRDKMRIRREKAQGMVWNQGEGDWIGLEEYLWNQPFRSNGEVASTQALILWISVQVFRAKFNSRSNYQLINKLIGLVETKKTLFDRSYQCRRRKEEIQEQSQMSTRKIDEKLVNKMNSLQQIDRKGLKPLKIRKFSQPSRIFVPSLIRHTIDYKQEISISLPKIQEKINLFPQEYKTAIVSPSLQKQLKQLQYLQKKQREKETGIRPKATSEIHIMNPQSIYKTLFNKIAFRFTARIPQMKTQRNSNRNVSEEPKNFRNENLKPVKFNQHQHYNRSIYNNFRVARQKGEQFGQKLQTLSILQGGSKLQL